MTVFHTLYFCAFLAAEAVVGFRGEIPQLPEPVDILADHFAEKEELQRKLIRHLKALAAHRA